MLLQLFSLATDSQRLRRLTSKPMSNRFGSSYVPHIVAKTDLQHISTARLFLSVLEHA
jgi:hypothetical protein